MLVLLARVKRSVSLGRVMAEIVPGEIAMRE